VLIIEVHNSNSSAKESWSTVPFHPPKSMTLPLAEVTWTVGEVATGSDRVGISLSANATALYVVLTTAAPGRFSDNGFLLEHGRPTVIDFISWDGELNSTKLALLRSSLRVEHLAENLLPPAPALG
jgi:hypothetical protein